MYKISKKVNNICRYKGILGKINPFKTLNFMQITNHYQRYSNNNIRLNNFNDNRYHRSNTSQDNKSSSLKKLVTDLNNNQKSVKPTIKLENKKDLIKSKYNAKDINYKKNKNKNHRITKSFNNLNVNSIHLNNNDINAYNSINFKNKKIHYNPKNCNQLKNIKGNQINQINIKNSIKKSKINYNKSKVSSFLYSFDLVFFTITLINIIVTILAIIRPNP